MKTVTLKVHGREMSFSEKELIAILEEHYFTKMPKEGKWFEVNPLDINEEIFEWERADAKQENVRQLILDAFLEIKNNPEYAKPFKTMIPEKNWSLKKIPFLKVLPSFRGYNIANWVHQALEWAQRIANGETWETICNRPDTTNCYRLVTWKDGSTRIIGGSRIAEDRNSPANINDCRNPSSLILIAVVPLFVSYM